MQKVREVFEKVFEKIKDWISRNPRAAFITALAVVVSGVFLIASALPSHSPAPVPGVAAKNMAANDQAKRAPAQNKVKQESITPITPIVNGQIEVHEFGENEMTQTTLGGVLPASSGVKIDPKQEEYSWGDAWDASSPDEVGGKSAIVTWPIGGRYNHLIAKIGFLPADANVHPGGKYEIFVDGQKVWEKTVTPDTVAIGQTADSTLDIDLIGKNALTLRMTATVYKDTSFGTHYRPTVPYPVVLYDLKMKRNGN